MPQRSNIQPPHPEHLLRKHSNGQHSIPKLDGGVIKRRATQSTATLVEKQVAINDTYDIRRGSSRVSIVTVNKENHFCVRGSKELRFYKKHPHGHISDRLIPVGSCNATDPSQEGPSMHSPTGASYLTIASLLEHTPKSPTRVSVKKTVTTSSPEARGILQTKGWRTQHSPGAAIKISNTIPSSPIVKSCAAKLFFNSSSPRATSTSSPGVIFKPFGNI